MSFCKYGCLTGFNSMVERESHENNCKLNPVVRFNKMANWALRLYLATDNHAHKDAIYLFQREVKLN